jgi:ribosomal protein L21E
MFYAQNVLSTLQVEHYYTTIDAYVVHVNTLDQSNPLKKIVLQLYSFFETHQQDIDGCLIGMRPSDEIMYRVQGQEPNKTLNKSQKNQQKNQLKKTIAKLKVGDLIIVAANSEIKLDKQASPRQQPFFARVAEITSNEVLIYINPMEDLRERVSKSAIFPIPSDFQDSFGNLR